MRRPRASARAAFLALALGWSAVSAGAASAADDAPPTSSELRRRGDEAMDAGRAAEALHQYRQAASLEPGPALDYNIGRALLGTGDFAGALVSFEKFQREAPQELRARTRRLVEIMGELETKVATLEVTGTPAGARVLVRGLEVGVLPLALRVNAGRAEVRIESPGHEPSLQSVELAGASVVQLRAALSRERAAGRLSVHASPANAGVTIDGRARGAAPVALELAPGAHQILVEAPAHRVRRFSIELAGGESRRVDITLEREARPLLKSPWFWAGVGLLVTGAAFTTVALTQERGPDDGSLGTFPAP